MRLRRSLAPAAAALIALACARKPAPTTAPPAGGADSTAATEAADSPAPGAPAEPPGTDPAPPTPGATEPTPTAPAPGGAAPAARSAPAEGPGQTLAATAPGAPEPAVAPVAARALEVTALKVVVRGAPGAPLARDGTARVDPGAAFELEVAAPLEDGRFALHDGADAMVPSTGEIELGDRASRFKITPVAPLRPGTAYTLVLDGATSREVHDTSGRAYAALSVPFKTAGDPPRALPSRKAVRKVLRRRR